MFETGVRYRIVREYGRPDSGITSLGTITHWSPYGLKFVDEVGERRTKLFVPWTAIYQIERLD